MMSATRSCSNLPGSMPKGLPLLCPFENSGSFRSLLLEGAPFYARGSLPVGFSCQFSLQPKSSGSIGGGNRQLIVSANGDCRLQHICLCKASSQMPPKCTCRAHANAGLNQTVHMLQFVLLSAAATRDLIAGRCGFAAGVNPAYPLAWLSAQPTPPAGRWVRVCLCPLTSISLTSGGAQTSLRSSFSSCDTPRGSMGQSLPLLPDVQIAHQRGSPDKPPQHNTIQ